VAICDRYYRGSQIRNTRDREKEDRGKTRDNKKIPQDKET